MKILGNVDLLKNQLLNAVVQNYNGVTDPANPFPSTPLPGQLVFRIDEGQIYICTVGGESPFWKPLIKVAESFVYTQSTVSTTWNIAHNLNSTNLIIQTYDSSNHKIEPDEITVVDSNNISLSFNPSTTGKAIILSTDLHTVAAAGELTAQQILDKIKTVDGNKSGLDADLVKGVEVLKLQNIAGTGAINIDLNQGTKINLTLSANTTVTFTNPIQPCNITIKVIQDATGGWTLTLPTILWVGSSSPSLTTTAGNKSFIVLSWDGTEYSGQSAANFG